MSTYNINKLTFEGKNTFIPHEKIDLIAIITNSCNVLITNTTGVFNRKISNKNHQCILATWHPTKPQIVLFWRENIFEIYEIKNNEPNQISKETKLDSDIKDVFWTKDLMVLLLQDSKVALFRSGEQSQYILENTHKLSGKPVKVVEQVEQKVTQSYSFVVGVEEGHVYSVNNINGCSLCFSLNDSIIELFYANSTLITITRSFFIYIHKTTHSGDFIELKKFKITGDHQKCNIFFAHEKYLGISDGTSLIKIYDVINEENYFVDLSKSCQESELRVNCLKYSPHKNLLVVSTWEKYVFLYTILENQFQHHMKNLKLLDNLVNSIKFGFDSIFLESPQACILLSEQPIICDSDRDSIVVQIDSNKYFFKNEKEEFHLDISFLAKGLSINENFIAFTNGVKIVIIKIVESKAVYQSTFECSYDNMAIIKQNIYHLDDDSLVIRNIKGQVKKEIKFSTNEGKPTKLTKFNNYLLVETSLGHIHLFDCNSRIPERASGVINVHNFVNNFGDFVDVKCNSTATFISFIIKDNNNKIIPKLFVANLYDNNIHLEFPALCTRHCWDLADHRFLICESHNDNIKLKILVCSQSTIKELESLDVPADYRFPLTFSQLRAFLVLQVSAVSIGDVVSSMRDLNLDEKLMEFAFLSIHGNIEEVFKCIRHVNDKNVWRRMLKICINSGDIKLCLTCLAKMEDTRSLLAYRSVKNQSKEVILSVLSACIGEKYEQRLLDSKNYKMLIKLYEAEGKWDKALDTASRYDRMRLSLVKFNKAKFEEFCCNYKDCFRDVLDNKKMWFYPTEDSLASLRQHITTCNKDMVRSFVGILITYNKVKAGISLLNDVEDYLNVVQLLCLCGKVEQAIAVSEKCSNPICYSYIGKYYENEGEYSKAVEYYKQSTCYSKAIRLLRDLNKQNEMAYLALQALPEETRRVALELENVNEEKALTLFQHIGDLPKAFEIADRLDHMTSYQDFMDNLLTSTQETDLVAQFALYFLKKGHVDKALPCLVSSEQFWTAIELCNEHKIVPTDALIDKIIEHSKDMSESNRGELAKVASLCMSSAKYELAGRVYMQIGMPQQALKALIRSGNTERVIMVANLSRDTQLYIMAGNYLQTQNWSKEPELMKHIIKFYTKAKAFNLMGKFYSACAQLEIDEYKNYSKAISAWKEAINYYIKANLPKLAEEHRDRIRIAEKFDRILNLPVSEREKDCLDLLEELDLESAVRKGHVHSCLVELYHDKKDWERAFKEVKMIEAVGKPKDYLDGRILNDVRRAMGEDDIFEEEIEDIEDLT